MINKLTGLALVGTAAISMATEAKEATQFPDFVMFADSVQKSEKQQLTETLVVAQEKFRADLLRFREYREREGWKNREIPVSKTLLLEKECISGIEEVASLLQLKPTERAEVLKKLSEKKVPLFVSNTEILVLISGMTPKQVAEISKLKTSFEEEGPNQTIGGHIAYVVERYQRTRKLPQRESFGKGSSSLRGGGIYRSNRGPYR